MTTMPVTNAAAGVQTPTSQLAGKFEKPHPTTTMKLTLLVQPDNTPDGKHPGFSSLCPELDIASQGDTEEEARANLREALELFLEDVDADELARRLAAGARVSQLELAA